MSLLSLDPVAIRHELAAQRLLGSSWPVAWNAATNTVEPDGIEAHVLTFVERNFKAAYFNDASSLGCCTVPPRDVSGAVAALFSLDPELKPVPVPPSNDHEYCRSGDQCDRLAVRGRHGCMWCEFHGAELRRLSVALKLDLARADPRNGGNTSLYSHKAA